MQPFWTSHNGETQLTLYQGDVLDVLRQLPAESVHCCITSPPYWGLRDYGVDGQIGLEETPDEYVEKMVQVFREVRRVLRPEGTLWLNLGDSYATGTKGSGGGWAMDPENYTHKAKAYGAKRFKHGLKNKDLVGIPWRVAFALQADGWWLRADIIWAKPDPMPESVTDRPTKAHEYVFLLTKSERYYYDAEAIREPLTNPNAYGHNFGGTKAAGLNNPRYSGNLYDASRLTGRNKRSVWWISTEPFPEAHFATFPTALVEPMILAGTSPRACPHCGAPWRRVVEHERPDDAKPRRLDEPHNSGTGLAPHRGYRGVPIVKELGWEPTCDCPGNDGSGRCVVLDPFNGSGTTMLVAQRLGRDAIGIELNPEYCKIARRRLEKEHLQVRLPVFDS